MPRACSAWTRTCLRRPEEPASASSALGLPPYYRTVVDFAIKVVSNANCLDDADFRGLAR